MLKTVSVPNGVAEFNISAEGLQEMLSKLKDAKYPGENVMWTCDLRTQLPIKLGKQDISALKPTTLIDEFKRVVQDYGNQAALSVKIDDKWSTLTYHEYYNECVNFAKSLLAFNVTEFTSINIIGFNAPEWMITFYGSLFCRCLPVGVYTTNNVAACEYIAKDSQARIVVAENREMVKKYFNLLHQKSIDLIIVYRDPSYTEPGFEDRIIQWKKFIALGQKVELNEVEKRISKVKPGNCCTLVYTSGTTSMPKGVMLSHDNYTWTKKGVDEFHARDKEEILTIVSYLPLSHVAGQFADITGAMMAHVHLYFAEPTALQGTLIKTLLEVRPKLFLSVPRVWEKIYEKMQEIAKQNNAIKTKIANWAKSLGPEGTVQQMRNQPTSWEYKLAKKLVYQNVKKAIGLDQCKYLMFGAAPLDPKIRSYFLSLGFFLINSYGMSESTGPQNFSDPNFVDFTKEENFREVGRPLAGTEMKIVKTNQKDEDGQICYRGRNTFMGYFKNPQETSKAIDSEGFLHSGDNGKFNKDGVLFITGRAKELIITAGGENIPPILIQNDIKNELPCLANAMLVGDMRNFLTCLLCLKEDAPGSGKLDKTTVEFFSLKGCEVKTVKEARESTKVPKIIREGIKKANEKAISRAQHVQQFCILAEEFSVQNGLLTPTMKLKRGEVVKRYAAEIQAMYAGPKL